MNPNDLEKLKAKRKSPENDDKDVLLNRLWVAERSNPDDLRRQGLRVAVHLDVLQNGQSYSYWLMSFDEDGITVCLRGEAATDQQALDQIRAQYAALKDARHHAPMCPANHYHGKRAPQGQCSCGATAEDVVP